MSMNYGQYEWTHEISTIEGVIDEIGVGLFD
jgi:hypothetical protein